MPTGISGFGVRGRSEWVALIFAAVEQANQKRSSIAFR